MKNALAIVVAASACLSNPAVADILVNNTSQGFYNQAIGTALNGSSPLFPTSGDPTIDPAPEPDVSPAAAILGDWLGSPNALNGNWTGPQNIPSGWTIGTETAIVYPFEATQGLTDFLIEVGVDNGAFVWLDGVYLGGKLSPGGVVLGELTLSVASVAPGLHFLQVLREDHGGNSGFSIRVTAEPSGPLVYCTAKTSSAGCVTTISTSDLVAQPVSGAGAYLVTAMQVQELKNGLLFAGINGAANLPFNGGVLCVQPPNKRGPIMSSGGDNGLECDGSYSTLVNDGNVIPSGLDAGPGNSAWYQYWYRDPMNGAGLLGTALSNAVQLDFQ